MMRKPVYFSLRKLFVAASLMAGCLVCEAENVRYIRGIVRDSITTEGLPYASLSFSSGISAVADSRGIFELAVPDTCSAIRAYSQGYKAKSVGLARNSFNIYDIYLTPEATELKELIVKKQKYSKRNNPAVDFAERLRNAGRLTDPENNPYYSFNKYERITLGVNNFSPDSTSSLIKRFPFLTEHMDTSEISGAPVLNLSVKETASTIGFRKDPRAEKEQITGYKRSGVDEFVNQENVQTVLNDLLREIDLYDSDIHLMRNTFVSPLSAIAPDFYRFYLTDTVEVANERCIVLAFYPRNKSAFGFSGHVYVAEKDSLMPVRRIEMRTPHDINLNFVKDLTILQEYGQAENGTRLKTLDKLVMELRVLPGAPELYAARNTAYTSHSFDPLEDSFYNRLGHTFTDLEAAKRDSAYWEYARTIPQRAGESKTEVLRDRLRSVPLYYWGEKILGYIVNGYIPTGENSRFDIGPINTFASYNSLEGLRLRAGGMTTAKLSKRWFARGYVAHGFRDHKWKYSAEAEYSFNDKKYHSREFPVHSLRLTHSYDVDRLGAHYLYTNADNFVLSLQRMPNNKYSYRRLTRLDYTLELNNNFSLTASAERSEQEESPFLRFTDFAGVNHRKYAENSLILQLRYAPGEKFIQTKSSRLPINEDAPVFILTHRFAPKGFGGSKFAVNRTEFSATKRFRLSLFGAADVMVAAGHVWSSSPFPDLLIPNANLSYTIQPYSFALMNPMEFINSSYVQWDVSYNARGALFNLIPGVRKLGLREVVGFRGLWGKLSKGNTPGPENPGLFVFPEDANVQGMGDGPYMEISAGLDNIFKILRVDYVWRLSYKNVPYSIDRRGLRVALHFTF